MKDVKYSLAIMQEEVKNQYISPEIKYAFETSIEALESQISTKSSLTKKEKSKIIIKHLEKDFELKSKLGETYLIMTIINALNEIESLDK